MKESEKRDLILKQLYEKKHDNFSMLKGIMEYLHIYESEEELNRIANRLDKDNYADIKRISHGVMIKISSLGIDYCEQDSYSHPGHPVINLNFSGVFNAANMIMGANNSNNHQSVTITSEAESLIKKIQESIQQSTEIDEESKGALMECIGDIDDKVKDNKKISKYQWSALLNNTAGLTQVSSFAIQLAQIFGYLSAQPTP